jgi:hypothetical protein
MRPSGLRARPQQVDDEKYDGQDKQNMNEKARHVEGNESQHPHNHEKDREHEQDITHLFPRWPPVPSPSSTGILACAGISRKEVRGTLVAFDALKSNAEPSRPSRKLRARGWRLDDLVVT